MPRITNKVRHCRKLAQSKTKSQHVAEQGPDEQRPQNIADSDSDESANDYSFPAGDDSFTVDVIDQDKWLTWTPGAEKTLTKRSCYSGFSDRTKRRKNLQNEKRWSSVEGIKPITSYFSTKSSSSTPVLSQVCRLSATLQSLANMTHIGQQKAFDRRMKDTSKFDYIRLLAVERYLMSIKDNPRMKIAESKKVANALFSDRPTDYQARQVRFWADYYMEHASLPSCKQGLHVKVKSLIYDEDVRMKCLAWLRSQKPDSLSALSFMKYLRTTAYLEIGLPIPIEISERQSNRWLHVLKFSPVQHKKGLYFDGHERDDVKEYRHRWLAEMEHHQRRFLKYTGEDMMTVEYPVLSAGEKPLIFVTHDESCFSSHDGKTTIWVEEGKQPLRPKGQGRSIMVSEFLCECHGPLKLSPELAALHPETALESLVVMKPGKNADGYWDNANLIDQLKNKALPIFKLLHPNADALFAFDNSTNHHAMAPDALTANRLNLSNGGKNVKVLRSGWFFQDGIRIQHNLQLENGVQKGVKQILQDRGLWPSQGLSLAAARKLLQVQPDFLQQMEWLEETVVAHPGFLITFFPKYHCEFNMIEMYWGACKRYARANCDYTFAGLERALPLALASVPLEHIRRYARECWRYMDAYRSKIGQFLTVAQVEFAVKVYSRHRSVPESILDNLA